MTTNKPGSAKPPTYPGSTPARVPQPGQFVPVAPDQSGGLPVARHVGPTPPALAPAAPRPAYADPMLFAEGIFRDQADYDQTVRLAVAKIRSGQIRPRQPDLEPGETS